MALTITIEPSEVGALHESLTSHRQTLMLEQKRAHDEGREDAAAVVAQIIRATQTVQQKINEAVASKVKEEA